MRGVLRGETLIRIFLWKKNIFYRHAQNFKNESSGVFLINKTIGRPT